MMRDRSLLGALALLGLLLAGLALELATPVAERVRPPRQDSAAAAPANAPQAAQEPDRSTQWRAELLARPLFSPSRKPDAIAAAGGQSATTAEPARLAGILVSDGVRRAIFQPAGKHPAIVATEGFDVGGWVVQAISADSVVVQGPGGTRSLQPKLDTDSASMRPSTGLGLATNALPAAPATTGGAPLLATPVVSRPATDR